MICRQRGFAAADPALDSSLFRRSAREKGHDGVPFAPGSAALRLSRLRAHARRYVVRIHTERGWALALVSLREIL